MKEKVSKIVPRLPKFRFTPLNMDIVWIQNGIREIVQKRGDKTGVLLPKLSRFRYTPLNHSIVWVQIALQGVCTFLSGPSPGNLSGLVAPARAHEVPADIAPRIVRTRKLHRDNNASTHRGG